MSGVSVRRRPCGGTGSSDRCQAKFVYALQEVGPRADLPFAARAHLTWVIFAEFSKREVRVTQKKDIITTFFLPHSGLAWTTIMVLACTF